MVYVAIVGQLSATTPSKNENNEIKHRSEWYFQMVLYDYNVC